MKEERSQAPITKIINPRQCNITLIDEFAKYAMHAIMMNLDKFGDNLDLSEEGGYDMLAESAYGLASTMVNQRTSLINAGGKYYIADDNTD